ncbi:nuclear speckle splicing regulatory protein 1-like isoform X1 [Acropora millepora]|uniref:nuclear speckle splicing regulatory protein 1-like isoform X1 n=2 Tax=Acropora millepora TaxID=45264 RepID=UPI001CF54CA2|nr:nuclear speckle splicing regulatory protein 1-like isoform X1 [Acropora millepora]
MGEPKRYGLIISSKKSANKPLKKLAAFGNDSSDEEDSAHKEVNISLIQEAQKKKQMKQTQIEIQKALKEDPTVYEYDAVYDKMEENKKAANVKDPEKDRKPKYIQGLLKSAAARKREYERTVERQVQKEREKEEGEFDDKEAFVTEAFRKKMQEQAEEEERLRRQEAIDAANDVTKQKDLSLFYRNLLNRNVSLGGTFTADDSTKTTREGDGNGKDNNSENKKEETRDNKTERSRDERRHSRNDKDRIHTKSPPHHSRHHEHADRKRRDLESDEERKRRSSDSYEKERRPRREDRDDPEHRPRSRHEDRRDSSRSRGSYDARKESSRKHDHRDDERNEKAEKVVDNKNEVSRESEKVKEKPSEETVSKFAKRSTDETVVSAKERYLARKRAREEGKATARNDDSDEE